MTEELENNRSIFAFHVAFVILTAPRYPYIADIQHYSNKKYLSAPL